jgi:hypothetical protein
MSIINPNSINGGFPVFGQDNATQGFRDNFTNIKNNFVATKTELEDLQAKVLLKTGLSGLELDNDMNGGSITNLQLKAYTQTYLDLGQQFSDVTVDFEDGNFQYMLTGNDITLSIINWPSLTNNTPAYATLRLWFQVSSTLGTPHTITFPAEVNLNSSSIKGLDDETKTITFPEGGNYVFDLSTVNGGTNIFITEVSRNRIDAEIEAQIDLINANVTAANAAIASLLSNAASQAVVLNTLTSNAASQAVELNTLTSNAASQATDLNTLTGNAASQAVDLNTLTSNAASQANSLTSLISNAATQAVELNTLTSNAATQAESLTSLLANAATQADSLNTLVSNAAGQATALNTLDANVGTLFLSNVTHDANIGTLRLDVNSLASGANANTAAYLTTSTNNISTGNLNITGIANIAAISEKFVANTNPALQANVTIDFAQTAIVYVTGATGNITANVKNFSIPSGTVSSITVWISQGINPYIANLIQINGSVRSINWQGSTVAPEGNATKQDVISFTILNNSGTYTVLGQLATFG